MQNTISIFEAKKAASLIQNRAKDIGIHLPRSASLELVAAIFSFNNYHELSAILSGKNSMDLFGTKIRVTEILEAAGSYLKSINAGAFYLVTRADDFCGDIRFAKIAIDLDALHCLIQLDTVGDSNITQPEVEFPAKGWNRTEMEFCPRLHGARESSFYFSGWHKHDESQIPATTTSIDVQALVYAILKLSKPSVVDGMDPPVVVPIPLEQKAMSVAHKVLKSESFLGDTKPGFIYFGEDETLIQAAATLTFL